LSTGTGGAGTDPGTNGGRSNSGSHGAGTNPGTGGAGSSRELRVRLGIEELLARGPGSFRRIGLLSNQAAILPDGRTSREALLQAGFPLLRLFGPEHGFKADAPDAVQVRDETLFNLEVVSLYGERSRPAREQVADLDAVVCDIQDVGCRYYTYVYTLGAVMAACRESGTELLVCDRPNPIGGEQVEGGPIPDEAANEVGGYGLAQRHGMTIGEVAEHIRRSYLPESSLTVVQMSGYTRRMHWAECGVPWKQPSPNLPSPDTALVYPGTCLFEGTNISEGRGTTRPFETIGAPWLNAEALRAELASRDLPGVIFSVSDFTPSFSTCAGEACRGIQLHPTDRDGFQPVLTGVHLLEAVRAQAPERFQWRPLWQDQSRSFVDWLAGGEAFRRAVESGAGAAEAYRILCQGAAAFTEARSHALLYD
jgi:uncharacterized protein YbbC (DUF1343 family)